MNSFEIIRTVRLTEKGTRQAEKYNQYTIMADPRANKTQIRTAVQDLFKVKVLKVEMMKMPTPLQLLTLMWRLQMRSLSILLGTSMSLILRRCAFVNTLLQMS